MNRPSHRWTLLACLVAAACADNSLTSAPRSARHAPARDVATSYTANWTLLASASAYPGTGFTTAAFAPEQNAIFVADAPDFATGMLARYDLGTGHWSVIPTSNWPIGKFRRIVYNPIHHAIITYWDGIGEVYAVSSTGGGWQRYGDNTDSDEYYEGGAFFDPVREQVASFAGYGLYRTKNTLWELDGPTTQWTLLQPSSPAPWPRIAPSVTVDTHHERLFVTDGQGSSNGDQYAPDERYLNDLWSLDLATLAWSPIIPLNDGPVRMGAPIAYDLALDAVLRFGGDDANGVRTNDLSIAALGSSPVAFQTVSESGATPAPRRGGSFFYDAHNDRLIYLGGYGTQYLPEVWALHITAH